MTKEMTKEMAKEMTKEELRKNLREQRNALLDKTKKSQLIMKNIISSPVFQKSSVVMLYRSAKGEVQTDELWQICKEQGKTCVFPKCVSKTEMIAVLAENEGDFSASKFGILEPNSDEVFPKEQIDLIIVPAIAFDQQNYRMGYGGGYYDRYLADYNGDTVGLCFTQLLVESVLPNEWDIPVSLVVTEQGFSAK